MYADDMKLSDFLNLLKGYGKRTYNRVSAEFTEIDIYGDGSGEILNDLDPVVCKSFDNLSQLLDILQEREDVPVEDEDDEVDDRPISAGALDAGDLGFNDLLNENIFQ